MSDSLYSAIQELLETDEELTLEQLEDIEELNFLKLEDTELASIESIGYCNNLSTLILPPIEDISPIGDLTNLEKLSVSDYELGGEAFAGLVNLIDLFYGKINPIDLQYLENPEMIEAFRFRMDIDTKKLPTFENLKVIEFYHSKTDPECRVTKALEHFSKTNSVEELIFYNYDLDIEELISCKSLKKIEITWLKGEDNNFDMLAGFEEFEELMVYTMLYSDETEEMLSEINKITNLKRLGLFGCDIDDISGLKDLKNLEYLNLSSNPITDISVVSNFKNLKYLDVYYANWAEPPVLDISMLKDLEFLEEVYQYNYAFSDDG